MSSSTLVFALVLTGLLLAISIIDFRTMRIPNLLTLGLAVSGVTYQASNNIDGLLLQTVYAAAVASLFLALRIAHKVLSGRIGLGLGDVKMAGAGALWLSPATFPLFLFTSSFTALAYAGLRAAQGRLSERSQRVPFGPFLAIGIGSSFLLEVLR